MYQKTKKIAMLLALFSILPLTTSCFYLDISHTSSNTEGNYTGPVVEGYYKTPTYTNKDAKENLNVKNMGAQLDYRYLPSTGDRKILVVPIQTKDDVFSQKELRLIQNGFFGESEQTGWESVSSFYKKSSGGKLNITGEVAPVIALNQTTAELQRNYDKYASNGITYTDLILEGAMKTLADQTSVDLSSYDTDKDGYLDAVWMVYSPFSNAHSDAFWAYTTWAHSNASFNGYKVCNYAWASVDFLRELDYSSFGGSENVADAHTFIHETGHLLGLDDYYSYDYNNSNNFDTPMGGVDMMDFNIGDHCAFSKYLLGWNTPTLVSKEYLDLNGPVLTLKAQKAGESFLIPIASSVNTSGMDYNYTPYDEYLLLEYYTPTGLNQKDSTFPGMSLNTYTDTGVLVYHVNARVGKLKAVSNTQVAWDGCAYDKIPLASQNDYNSIFMPLYSNTYSYSIDQTIKDRGMQYYRGRLVSLLPATGSKIQGGLTGYANNQSLFKKGDRFSDVYQNFKFDDGSKPLFDFTIGDIKSDSCTIMFE